ncbi:gamma-glutamyltransferase family protein [Aquabacter spiritensis]|uniref:Gamma-glutamyltranspeptidase/glutathione hydrolase n=1 Tax=Aquabacter spiritensis TaxID=933073 RepID=A0A4R3LUZ6_9HYPH|nr:gamma-glutamyltransferase [Aquabacter spiritensis]TCT04382.1 gamma-glutamyltranspeptidase/glutathione hydrolase [Aquabacter spiritensis]
MSRLRALTGGVAAISCSHPAAAVAGWEMLAQGGGVVDAALACASVLTVVQPQACSLGGDAFIMVHEAKSGRTFGINASGRAPQATDPDAFGETIPIHGARSATVPGVVAGWDLMHARFGRRPWAELFTRAIAVAQDGFAVSPYLAAATRLYFPALATDPGAARLFLDGGAATPGALLRQPALAATLERLAKAGARDFYTGETAAALAACVRARGGWMTRDDLAACSAEWVAPLAARFRGLEVKAMPPNSYGLYMLLQLAALESRRLDDFDPLAPDRFAALIRAAHAAFAMGAPWVADGGRDDDPLAAPNLAALRAGFADEMAAGADNKGGTSVVAVADAAGNAAAIVQSVFMVYGAAVADAATGILLNDRMIGFTTRAGHPNRIAPGKRPAHTLNPCMTFDEGRLRHVLLTPGGPGQTLTLTQVLQAMTDHGLSLAAAAALPRWSMDLTGASVVEAAMPQATLDGLAGLGLAVGRGADNSPFFGSVEAVMRDAEGRLTAVADDRREAFALAL